MEFHSKKLEGQSNKQLSNNLLRQYKNQQFEDKLYKIYFEYELLNPLNIQIDDISVKQSLSECLNKIQDAYNLKVNYYILKIKNWHFLQKYIEFKYQKNVSTNPANIKIMDSFNIRRIKLQTNIRFTQVTEQISKIPQRGNQQQLKEVTNQKEINQQFFQAQTQSSECVQNNQSQILQGDLLIFIQQTQKQQFKVQKLYEQNLYQIILRIASCILFGQKITNKAFKENDLVLQNDVDYEFNKEQEIIYVNLYFSELQIDQIKVLEIKQIVNLDQPKQQQQQIIKEKKSKKEVVGQQNQQQQPEIKGRLKQEYFIILTILRLMNTIYLKILF
ncbi:unnamed protein product [Paramecium pentaurelia]|uniref:Uncharacterized protein n=1 Tax=Paramecium pentaurelia TaxID=43138 RepID=A0A8S1U6U7_9CILI|nr:unnamed protein product [Paramecium pentaurelia]